MLLRSKRIIRKKKKEGEKKQKIFYCLYHLFCASEALPDSDFDDDYIEPIPAPEPGPPLPRKYNCRVMAL